MLAIRHLSVPALLFLSHLVSGHGHVTSWTINGEKRPGWNPGLPSEYGPTAERPTDSPDQGWTDHTSGDVACGTASAGEGVLTWDLDAGSQVTVRWYIWPIEHRGPVTEYMGRCPGSSCDGVAADSLDWFKIAETGYQDGIWPTEQITNDLEWSFDIPSDLVPGPYLVRHSILAMHFPGKPQVYPLCFQANLKGSGTARPAETVRFPAAYIINTDFETFNLYTDDLEKFVPPGPPVYSGQTTNDTLAAAVAGTSTSPLSQTSSAVVSTSSGVSSTTSSTALGAAHTLEDFAKAQKTLKTCHKRRDIGN